GATPASHVPFFAQFGCGGGGSNAPPSPGPSAPLSRTAASVVAVASAVPALPESVASPFALASPVPSTPVSGTVQLAPSPTLEASADSPGSASAPGWSCPPDEHAAGNAAAIRTTDAARIVRFTRALSFRRFAVLL